jgi:hypothetical protein
MFIIRTVYASLPDPLPLPLIRWRSTSDGRLGLRFVSATVVAKVMQSHDTYLRQVCTGSFEELIPSSTRSYRSTGTLEARGISLVLR